MNSCVLFSVFALLGCVAGDMAAALQEVAIDDALKLDDQCGGDRDRDAHCAFKALQVKVSRHVSQDNACTQGLLGRIRNYSTSCFDACPVMCEPMGDILETFLETGGGPLLKDIICSNQEKFHCALAAENRAKCDPLFDQARSTGFNLPSSVSGLSQACITAAEDQILPDEQDACTTGVVGQIRSYGVECFDACPDICKPLDQAVSLFFEKNGMERVKDVVCSEQEAFHCALTTENFAKCEPILSMAQSSGFNLPSSVFGLVEACSGIADEVDFAKKEENICTAGVVGHIRSYGTACFDACPSMCGPLHRAAQSFHTKGRGPTLKDVVCSHQEEFHCAFLADHHDKCHPIIAKAQSWGINLPTSISGLAKTCVESSDYGAEVEADVADTCTTGLVGLLRQQAPACFDACPTLCRPLDHAAKNLFKKGGGPTMKDVVCSHQEEFHCAFHPANRDKCEPIIAKAARSGFNLPYSMFSLAQACAA